MPSTSIAAVLGLWLLAAPALAAPATSGYSTPTDEEIRSMLRMRVDVQASATGAVVGIVGPRGRRVVAYGAVAAGDARQVDANTVFDVGSVTKVFTALLLAEMVQRGEVALDDPVAMYLPPGVRLPRSGGSAITLLDLATHTAGLPLRPNNLVSGDPRNKYAGYTTELMYRCLSSLTLTRPSGAQYEYSNLGYALLGIALARRAGQSYAELLRRLITKPLGLADTRIDLTPEMRSRWAVGYSAHLEPVPHWDFGALEAAGALHSTAADLMTLLEAVLGYRKSELAPAMSAMLATRRPGGMPPSTQIALAWNVLRDRDREIAWKNGSVGGFRAFIGYDTQTRVGVVALANAQTGAGVDDIGLHVLDPKQHVDLHIPRAHHEVAVDPKLLDRYVGRYRFSATDVIIVLRRGNRLFARQEPMPDELELFAEGPRDFFLKIVDAQLTFEATAAGPARAVIWHQGGVDDRGVRE